MRVIFFGSSGFSVPILNSVAKQTVLVVTKKAKPKGRGYALDDNEVKRVATALGLPLMEIDSFKDDLVKTLPDYRPDLFVVASFGLIVPEWVLDIPSRGPLNIHPSLLPLYRGPSPMQWALLKGDAMTGITLIRMNVKMDEGDVVYQEQVMIEPGENLTGLSKRLAARSAEILPEFLGTIETQGMMSGTVQRHEIATYTPIITKEMGKIDWTRSAAEIDRQVRAFVEWPVAYTFLDNKMIKIFDVAVEEGLSSSGNPGQIRGITKKGVLVDTAIDVLMIKDLQMENKKRMAAFDFARGYRDLTDKVLS
jgi:methionyl-tRNA formyltransferase